MEQALPAAMIIGTLVDPMATLLNANGDLVSAMLVTRIAEGKNGCRRKQLFNKVKFFVLNPTDRTVFIGVLKAIY
jgi:hypothetical protein